MKFSQIERGINNFSAVSRGDKKFNRVFHPVSTAPPRELKNDNSLRTIFTLYAYKIFTAYVRLTHAVFKNIGLSFSMYRSQAASLVQYFASLTFSKDRDIGDGTVWSSCSGGYKFEYSG